MKICHIWSVSTLATLALLILNQPLLAQNNKKLAETDVTLQSVKNHVYFLASDDLKGRDTPSPGQDSAAAYIARNFKRWGVQHAPGMDSYFQLVRMVMSQPSIDGSLTVGDSVYSLEHQLLQLSDGEADIIAPVVFVDYGTEEDFEQVDVKGKLVIARCGTKSAQTARAMFREGRAKAERTLRAGGVALIELYNSPQTKWNVMQFYLRGKQVSLDFDDEDMEESDFQHLWLDDSDNSRLAVFRDLNADAHLVVSSSNDIRFTSQNVVGWIPGTDSRLKDEVIVYSAHYDHVGIGRPNDQGDSIYNGTRDNAIGTMTVMEAAKSIASRPLKRSSLFILFTGEEKGLLGSEWYVNHPVLPLENTVFCFNSDNAGYNDVSKTTVVGLNRSSAGPVISKSASAFGLKAIDDPVPSQNLFDRSDQANFARAGVPAVMYSMGLTDFDDEILKYYHQAADNPDSVDYEYLLKFTRAYVYAARELGNLTTRPVWEQGDKYFEAGEKLYAPKP